MKPPSNNNSNGMFITNHEGTILFANWASQLFGYSAEELIGQSIEQILVNGQQVVKRAPSALTGETFELEGTKKESTAFQVSVELDSFSSNTENFVVFSLSKQDIEPSSSIDSEINSQIIKDLRLQIKKRKDIEQKLVKIQQMYDTVVHNFPDGVIGVLNRDMKYVLIDGKELHEINLPSLGLGASKRTGATTHLKDEEILNKIENAFTGAFVEFEMENENKFYDISIVPLPDMVNDINEILFVIKNITERKRMEEGLLAALEKEKELGELKSRFVTMASHEFKTPLAMILSSAFLLENFAKADYEKEKGEHTNRIKRSVNNLTVIINEILAIEKLEDNLVKVQNVVLHIPKLFNDFISEIEFAKQEGQHIEYRHIGSQQTVFLDQNLLWSILTNLISNGLKYSKKGDTVRITTSIKKKKLTIEVTDNGMGIPMDEQNHIFERFFRARNTVNIDGTGLGLHIVEKNVKLLKGSIQFVSNVNSGTKFTVILPDGQPKKSI